MTLTATAARTTPAPLVAGIAAGPLFVGACLVQAFTRDGFDLGRHPISLLARGDLGWIQITNFVLTGILYVACAAGLRRRLPSAWGARLVALVGVGLVIAGVFVTDAGAGFPPGAPEGAPRISWHGVLHELGFTVVIVSWTAACFFYRRLFAAAGERRWARSCVAAPAGVLLVLGWPDLDSLSVRLVLASALQFGFLAALCLRAARHGRPS